MFPIYLNVKNETMANWKGIIGKAFSQQEFDAYCHTLSWTAWRPSFIVLHNTAIPNLSQRPNGFSDQHIKNLEAFYRDTQGWKAGPHLFIDDKQIWVFTPLTVSGTHSPSWNKTSIGIEMLGNYATDDFNTGRGLKVQENTIAAIASLSAVLGLNPASMRLHREDPLTTHKCPGNNVNKTSVIKKVEDLLAARHSGDHPTPTDKQQ